MGRRAHRLSARSTLGERCWDERGRLVPKSRAEAVIGGYRKSGLVDGSRRGCFLHEGMCAIQ